MKKLFISIAILMMVAMSVMSCKPHGSDLGPFLKITVTGKYKDENTGKTTDGEETLKAYVNLASKTFFRSREATRGNRGGGAHVNGFIMKGPFINGNDVKVDVEVLDKNYNVMPVSTEIANTAVLNGSKLSVDISKADVLGVLKDKIVINMSVFTTAQAERIEKLVTEDNMSYNDAYEKSKKEILEELSATDFSSSIGEFHQLDATKTGKGNEFLLVASAVFSEKANTNNSLVKKFVKDMKDGNLGESLKQEIKTKKSTVNLTTMVSNLRSNIKEVTGNEVTIATPSDTAVTGWLGNGNQ